MRTLSGSASRRPDRHERSDSVVILTALDLEYAALRSMITVNTERCHPAGTLFEVGRRADRGGQVIIAQAGIGNNRAASITERAISLFQPRAVLFVGVAGALHDDLELGDVVVATKVYAYNSCKHDTEGEHSRPEAWQAPHEIDQLARRVVRVNTWPAVLAEGVAAPRVHFKPIASGDAVLDSRSSQLSREIQRNFNDAVAIDMESAGAATAGQLNPHTPVLMIRGVSDHADGNKAQADRTGSQDRAAAHAAALAISVAAEILTGRHPDQGRGNVVVPGAVTASRAWR